MDKSARMGFGVVFVLWSTICVSLDAAATDNNSGATLRYATLPYVAPYFVAQNDRLFEKYLGEIDASVEYLEVQSGHDEITAIIAGSADMGCVGSPVAVTAIAQGLPLRVVSVAGNILSTEGLVVKKSAGIEQVSDLRGKKVATVFNSSVHYMLSAALKFYDVSGVQLVNLNPAAIAGAWHQGGIQAAWIWQPTLEELVNEDGKLLMTDGDLQQLSEQKYIQVDVCVASDSFIKEHPDLLVAALKALDEAAKMIRNDPEGVAKRTWRQLGLRNESVATEYFKGSYFPTASEQVKPEWMGSPGHPGNMATQLTNIWAFLKELGSVTSTADKSAVQEGFHLSALNRVAEECGPELASGSC